MSDLGHSDDNKFVGSDGNSNLRKRKRYRVVPSPLLAIQWWRVCLDEAQRVEQPTAASAKMALKLKSELRWCVTGTPVGRGKLEDLYGLLLFLGLNPFMIRTFFNKALDSGHCNISERIKQLLGGIFWRSTKANELVREQMGVPEQTEKKNLLRFSSVEKHFYERQLQETLSTAGDFAERRRSGKKDKVKQLNLLAENLHRLRAACCHPQVGAGGISKMKKSAVGAETSRVLSMEEILVKLIDDARLKCEESQRQANLHTNGMAALSRLKVEARERGQSVNETDEKALEKSCKLYLESLELAKSNSQPTRVLADATLTGNTGFRTPHGVMHGGSTVLDWKMDGQNQDQLWARIDFEGPARRLTRLKLRPVTQVPDSLSRDASPDIVWTILRPQTCVLEVSNTNLGGEFVEVTSFPCISLDQDEWIVEDEFRASRSKSWRLVFKSFPPSNCKAHLAASYLGVEVMFDEADISNDSLQKLHALHNACISFESLLKIHDGRNRGGEVSGSDFLNIAEMKKKIKQMSAEAASIEETYLKTAQSIHRACKQRFLESSAARERAEQSLKDLASVSQDLWDTGWWEDFLVACQIYGSDDQKRAVFQTFYEEVDGYQASYKDSGLVFFPRVGDLSGLVVAFRSRVESIREGLGKKVGWLGTAEGGTFQRRKDYFKCSAGAYTECMKDVATLKSSPSSAELYENTHCKICKADWNQQGPQCRHCKIGDRLNELEPDRVTVFVLTTLYNILRGSLGTQILASASSNLSELAKLFFDALEAQKREKVVAWRQWRTHLDLLNDMDELNQCKESMRLSYTDEDLTALTKDQLNAVVMPCDISARYYDHAAKQAMALGDLRRSKETLRYLRNQSLENQQQSGRGEEENCVVCLCPFESERAVLRCGHSFHLKPCLEGLKTGHRSISCPMRCRLRTTTDDVLIASEKPRDDGSSMKRNVKGSWGTKVTKVVSDLLDIKDLGEKAILFSQWEDMLDIVEEALRSNDVSFVRSVSLAKIGEALKIFRSRETTVLMLNVKNGAEGLTILEARHVLMLEPLLNNALDSQAINRVCRIGQRHKTTVHRYVVESTVEVKIDEVRMMSSENAIEDTKFAKPMIRAGGLDGGFSSEDELMNLLALDEREASEAKKPTSMV